MEDDGVESDIEDNEGDEETIETVTIQTILARERLFAQH